MVGWSELVMGKDHRCRSDVKIIRYPYHFEDEARGSLMFNRVMGLLNNAEAYGGGNQ